MKKFDVRKNIRKIHLWIGLFTGAIVFIVCITGSIYAFQKEIRMMTHPYYSVEAPLDTQSKLPLEDLLNTYEKQSKKEVIRIYDFTQEKRSTILLTSKDKNYYFSFLNPYNGKLLKEKNLASDFFVIVLYIHQNLLLGEVGTQIIGWSVVLFIISLITGLILWFPKNTKIFKTKKGRKSKFSIKTKSKKTKVVFDLHSVLGFYGASILLIIAITGIAWTFTWVDDALYSLVTFEKKTIKKTITVDSTHFSKSSLDFTKNQLNYQQKDRSLFIYFLPQNDTIPLKVTAYPNDDSYGSSDHYYSNASSGKLIKTELDKDKNAGDKLHTLYYDIHTGSLIGIWGKILVFFAGLIGASLPVTGVMMWSNTRKKKLKKKKIIQHNNKFKSTIKNTITMRTKISILWIFIAIGFILHHIYGLATVFFNESVFIEGSTGETPFWAHQWRILMEGLALTFGLLTLQVSKKWFRITSFIWAIILGLFNAYHIVTAVIYEASNFSEILILLLLVIASVFLVQNINQWRKEQV